MDEKGFDYLNVIPLVDVMLVLLTIVLTTSTFIATGGIHVELPKAVTSDDQKPPLSSRTVVIDREGRIWVDAEEIPIEAMTVTMKDIDRKTPILVRADKYLELQRFVDVFSKLKELGFTQMSLQTEHTS